MNAWRNVWGPTDLLMPAWRAKRRTIRHAAWRSSRSPLDARKIGTFDAFTDGEVDGAGGARRERDDDDLAALAGDGECAVSAFDAKRLDVGAEGFADSQPVDGEQRDQSVVSAEASPAATSRAPTSLRSRPVAWDS